MQQTTFWLIDLFLFIYLYIYLCFCTCFRENKAWHCMWIVCLADNSHEMPSLTFLWKLIKKKIESFKAFWYSYVGSTVCNKFCHHLLCMYTYWHWLCWGLTTRQPLWVILYRLPEKGRKEIEEIVEEMKETIREEIGTGMKVKKQKK